MFDCLVSIEMMVVLPSAPLALSLIRSLYRLLVNLSIDACLQYARPYPKIFSFLVLYFSMNTGCSRAAASASRNVLA